MCQQAKGNIPNQTKPNQNQKQNKASRGAAVLLNIINYKIQRAEWSELMNAYEMPLHRCAKRTSSPGNTVPVRFRPTPRIRFDPWAVGRIGN